MIGFRNWKNQPFAENYLGFTGPKGRFLGFYAVIMQAAFSFFGSEVPGIVRRMIFSSYVSPMSNGCVQAAGEVIDATRVRMPSVLVSWLTKSPSLRGILTFCQNVPRALRKVWIRMYVWKPPFFVLGASPSRHRLDCMHAMPVRYSTWGGS